MARHCGCLHLVICNEKQCQGGNERRSAGRRELRWVEIGGCNFCLWCGVLAAGRPHHNREKRALPLWIGLGEDVLYRNCLVRYIVASMPSTTTIAIVGAAGRMGQRLVALGRENPALS